MTTCYENTDLPFPLKLEQSANGKFRVTYGQQIFDKLDYGQAAKELSECLMHALACDGKLETAP